MALIHIANLHLHVTHSDEELVKKIVHLVNINTNTQTAKIMETFETLTAKFEALTPVLGDIKTSLTGIDADIADLKAQITALPPAGGVVTQEQLDALGASLDTLTSTVADIKTSAASIDDETPGTTPV